MFGMRHLESNFNNNTNSSISDKKIVAQCCFRYKTNKTIFATEKSASLVFNYDTEI